MINAKEIIIQTAQAGVISDAPGLAEVGGNVLNFLLSVFGVLAIISLAISGGMYFMSSGNQKQAEKAKRMATYSAIGIVVALGAMIIVRQISAWFG